MSMKRVPLANNPNAANSPYRVPASTKRTRAQALDNKDAENCSPPKKKQLLSVETSGLRRAQHISPNDREGRVFLGKPDNTATNAFNRRLAAVKESRVSHHRTADKDGKVKTADAETVKQWRKHYRGAFPSFVFYFESLPADVAAKSTKQIMSLGAVCRHKVILWTVSNIYRSEKKSSFHDPSRI
jgi:regulatory subunit for Cdc7p protein kinase